MPWVSISARQDLARQELQRRLLLQREIGIPGKAQTKMEVQVANQQGEAEAIEKRISDEIKNLDHMNEKQVEQSKCPWHARFNK